MSGQKGASPRPTQPSGKVPARPLDRLWKAIAAGVSASEGGGGPPPARPRPAPWHWSLLALAILLFGIYYGALALCLHDSFVSSRDLADVNQAMWNTIHGRFLKMTARPSISSFGHNRQ